MSGGDLTFFSANLGDAAGWYDALGRGELVTPAQRNAAVVLLGAALDVLADPVHTLGAGEVRLPMAAYAGTDRELAAKGARVPVVGAVPVPSHWRTGAQAPVDLPAWVRASDAERRTLYGAVQVLLGRLARTGERRPAEGQGAPGSGWLPVAFAAFAGVTGVAAALVLPAVVEEAGAAARTWLREEALTARFALLLKAQLEGYKTRAEIAQRTGTWPPPTAAEEQARTTPFNAGTSEPPQTTNQAGADWWKSGTAWTVLGGTALVAALAGVLGWAWTRTKTNTDDTADAGTMDAPSAAFDALEEGDDTWTQ